jgi:3-hydroxybutyryl-CoA dehydrogenase
VNTENVKSVSVLGAGVMGQGIAQSFAMGGYPVNLYDIADDILEVAHVHIEDSLRLFSEAQVIQSENIKESLDHIKLSSDLKKSVSESDLVIEAAPEKMEIKQDLFHEIEKYCSEKTILTTNTSHLKLSDIFSNLKLKSRTLATHWFNPPQIVPTVEVVKHQWTDDSALELTYSILKQIGKEPVKIQLDIQGFLVNRILIAIAREALDLFDKGVASAEDIDRAIKGSVGFRYACIGPLRTIDLGGVEGWLDACYKLFPLINSSTEPPKSLEELMSKGSTGIHSGEGFYRYASQFLDKEIDPVVSARDKAMFKLLKLFYREKNNISSAR